MARGMNRAMIIGFVEREPEVRQTAKGEPVSSFGVSTSRRWTTSSGQSRESTEWFQIVAWGRLAELACRKLRKNQRVYAEGHIQTRNWEADGQRHYLTEFVASRLIPLSICSYTESEGPEDEGDEALQCLNRVMVIGNLGRDPEMRYTPAGQAVTSFNLAATRSSTAGNGERRDSTEWFNVVSWGSLAEICNQYLTKGRRVFVEGELRSRCWDQPNGQKHFRTELVASEMIMLGPRPAVEMNDEPLA
jgi:single-strand DNA-binding protein